MFDGKITGVSVMLARLWCGETGEKVGLSVPHLHNCTIARAGTNCKQSSHACCTEDRICDLGLFYKQLMSCKQSHLMTGTLIHFP